MTSWSPTLHGDLTKVAAAGNYAADTNRIIESAIAVEQAQAKTTVRKITATITPGTPRLTARH